jgi:hypothetical protein
MNVVWMPLVRVEIFILPEYICVGSATTGLVYPNFMYNGCPGMLLKGKNIMRHYRSWSTWHFSLVRLVIPMSTFVSIAKSSSGRIARASCRTCHAPPAISPGISVCQSIATGETMQLTSQQLRSNYRAQTASGSRVKLLIN